MAQKSRTGMIITILILIIVVLAAVLLYFLVINPSINGYVINKQIEAQDATLNAILLQIQQQGYAQISDAEGNVVVLVPYNPPQE